MKINRISYSSAHPKKFLVKEPNIDCGWNLVHWCNKSRGDKRVRNKKLGSPCSFSRHNAKKSWRLFGTLLGRARPKTRQKGEIFLMMHVASHRIWLECIVYPLTYKKNALVFTLRSNEDLIWTLAVRPVTAQSVHFNKISKTRNIDLCQFFFSLKGTTVLTKIMKQKVGVTVLVFAVELQKVHTKCISLRWD